MSNDTTEKQIADLREDVAKILRNQAQLEGLIAFIGRKIFTEAGTREATFDAIAKSWKIDG